MANAWAAEFDANIARPALLAIGLADTATYTAPGGSPIACTALVDYDIAKLGDVATANDRIAIVTLFKDQVARPTPRAVVVVGSVNFTLQDRNGEDDSHSVWIARYGN